MIGPFLEGVWQSPLPCSWIILAASLLLGMAARRVMEVAVFACGLIVAVWLVASGWLAPPLWVAGSSMALGGVAMWRWGSGPLQAVAVGVGAAWAWQPCVGPELGGVLDMAQTDPVGALPGLAAFLIGLLLVGVVLGVGIARLIRARTDRDPARIGAVLAMALGLLMVSGVYQKVASALLSWSNQIIG
jgi:cytochrome c biogenesis protein CcdA